MPLWWGYEARKRHITCTAATGRAVGPRWLHPLRLAYRLPDVVSPRDLLAASGPSWISCHSEPNIDAIVALLDDEMRDLYRGFLIDEIRVQRPGGLLPAWRAFDRAMCELSRRSREGRRS